MKAEANHCYGNYACTLHDCHCPCDGCLPHSNPDLAELKRLRPIVEAAREYIEAHDARKDPNACPDCGGERGEAHCCGPVHIEDHKRERLRAKLREIA